MCVDPLQNIYPKSYYFMITHWNCAREKAPEGASECYAILAMKLCLLLSARVNEPIELFSRFHDLV
jgi:hypothetical protein